MCQGINVANWIEIERPRITEKLVGCDFVENPVYPISQLDEQLKNFITEEIDNGIELFRIETALERALNIIKQIIKNREVKSCFL